MSSLATLLFLIGAVGSFVSVVLIIVKAIKKKPIKKALIVLLACVICSFVGVFIMPISTNDEIESNETTIQDDSAEEKTTSSSDVEKEQNNKPEEPVEKGQRNENLKGRGRSDEGRNEPNYVGVIGYAAVSSDESYDLEQTDDIDNPELWTIPTYEKDNQFWNETEKTIPHKSEVLVKNQELEHEGWGSYSGYLKVEDIKSSEEYFINVRNFITKPYWENKYDIIDAASEGALIGEYHQNSEYYPVNSSGEKVDVDEGVKLLVCGTSNSIDNTDPDTKSIEAVVWKEWSKGYGGVKVYFNPKDLTKCY